MNRRDLRIGLIGLGCVGSGLVEVINQTKIPGTSIVKIGVKDRAKNRAVNNSLLCYNWEEVVEDGNVNVVVELIDDSKVAFEIVKKALTSGKSVVSANKKMISENLEELIYLQKKHQVSLLYEAACCASIPIIRNLEEYYDNDLLDGLEGIVNGSTNYILGKTIQDGLSFEAALLKAQQLGYAETDPKLDIEGFDARYKLHLLLLHAFGEIVPIDEILKIGINNLKNQQIQYAKEKSLSIKLVAYAGRNSSGDLSAFVLPKYIKQGDKLSHVNDVYNGIKLNAVLSDEQFFVGKGAGSLPTASAVLSDISALSYGYKYEYRKFKGLQGNTLNDELILKVQLAFDEKLDEVILNSFIAITERFQNYSSGYVIGEIKVKELKHLTTLLPKTANIILVEVLNKIQDQVELEIEDAFSH